MTLKQLKAVLMHRDWVSSHELASYFGSDTATIEKMMSHWIGVGNVIKKTSCDNCHGCHGLTCDVYHWQS